ncbi:Magnesium transporting ATPase, P-type 1 [Salmonella enterica subsp. enterica serovar Typhimurium]|nr:Magnesium transporting ATPase, P-type 1 [Salmonella enterica subsp. enterica serovar Typhimurium]
MSGVKSSRVLMLAWLNSSSQSGARNVMDRAHTAFWRGVESHHRQKRASLNAMNCHSTLYVAGYRSWVEDAQHGDRCLICKGAVEEMMMVATHLREGDRVVALTETPPPSYCWRKPKITMRRDSVYC